MNSMQNEYNELCTGRWAEANPRHCPCRGTGWMVSDLDTAHNCPIHCLPDSPHPEEERDEPLEVYQARRQEMYRRSYRHFLASSQMTVAAFRAACRARIEAKTTVEVDDDGQPTPQEWVDAAESIATEAAEAREQARARAQGYGSVFEMHMADEAAEEAAERRRRW